MSKILSLDQASKISGWAFYDNGKLEEWGHFTISNSQSMEKRLYDMMNHLNDLYAKFEFNYLVFEDIQMQSGNAKTFKTLAYIQATILLWCYMNDIKYSIYLASEWRKIISKKTGISFGRKREEQKQAAQDYVHTVLEHGNVTEDECDAILIGLAHIFRNLVPGF